MKNKMLTKQTGFSILGAFFLLAILIGAVAFFISGNSVNASKGQNYTASARASGLITQGSYLSGGFSTMVMQGVLANDITMDSNPTTGLFNVSGGVLIQIPDSSSLIPLADRSATDATWNHKFLFLSIGGVSDTFHAVSISGISEAVCLEINNFLGGFGGIPVITNDATDPTYDFSFIPVVNDKDRGCFYSNDGKFVYFQSTGLVNL